MLPLDAPWDLATSAPRYLRPSTTQDVREFARLVEEGLLRRVVADVHVGLDAPDERRVRAGAALELLPERLIDGGAALTGEDAAWFHAGGEAPDRLHVVMPVRRSRAGTPHVVVHEGRVPEADVEVLDGVPVTSPARAAADVARGLTPDRALPLLRRLATAVPLEPRDALVQLERLSGCRGVEAGRRTVLAWAAERGAPTSLSPAPWWTR